MAKFTSLDPIELLQTIRAAQQELVALADCLVAVETDGTDTSTLEQFLNGLRTAWRDGEIRPTNQPKPKAPRGRRRPDPFAAVTAALREWFEAEPWRTSGELFERLRQEHPGAFADGQQRTLQRRLKIWRSEMAQQLVFGSTARVASVAPEAQPNADPAQHLSRVSRPDGGR
jgi:hypothetical protein